MSFPNLPPLLLYLEYAMMLISTLAFVFAMLLMRAARNVLRDSKPQPVLTLNTPLTRRAQKRARETTLV